MRETEAVAARDRKAAAKDSDQAIDRLARAELCHLGFLSMKLILVVRSVSIVITLNWPQCSAGVTAAKPTSAPPPT